MDRAAVTKTVQQIWDESVLPSLSELVEIPAVSPAYDADWEANGHMEAAVSLVRDWCAARPIAGLTVDVQRLPGRTPLITCEIAATDASARGFVASPLRGPCAQAVSRTRSSAMGMRCI